MEWKMQGRYLHLPQQSASELVEGPIDDLLVANWNLALAPSRETPGNQAISN